MRSSSDLTKSGVVESESWAKTGGEATVDGLQGTHIQDCLMPWSARRAHLDRQTINRIHEWEPLECVCLGMR